MPAARPNRVLNVIKLVLVRHLKCAMKKTASCLLAFLLLFLANPAPAAQTRTFKLVVSEYVGWMPWIYAARQGVLKKWGNRYKIDIQLESTDYVPSVEAFSAGQADAAVMTNMEALNMPAAAGVDTSVIIVGDYSKGNDAILVNGKLTLKELKGRTIHLAERTVSHYLLSRALDKAALKESDVRLVNVSENDITNIAAKKNNIVVTWNPLVRNISRQPGINKLFDSSQIPGEIQDLLVIKSRVLKTNPDLARALVGAWYEVMGKMTGPAADETVKSMASLMRTSPSEFKAQLSTSAMFYTPSSALEYMRSKELMNKQELVRKFCFRQGLLGENARSADVVGIQFPDGTVYGDRGKIKLRYVDKYTAEAAGGK